VLCRVPDQFGLDSTGTAYNPCLVSGTVTPTAADLVVGRTLLIIRSGGPAHGEEEKGQEKWYKWNGKNEVEEEVYGAEETPPS